MREAQNLFEKPLPVVTPITKPYWDALKDEQIRLQYCGSCKAHIFYPRSHCPSCLNPELEWQNVEGSGALHTFTITRQPTAPHFADEVPQILAMVDLDIGVRLTSTLKNVDADSIKVGMRLKPYYDHVSEEITLLRFQPDR